MVEGGGDALALRGVRVEDQRGPLGKLDVVDAVQVRGLEGDQVVGQARVGPEGDGAHQRVREDLLLVGLEVLVHGLAVRGEQAEHHALLDRPALEAGRDRAGRGQHAREVGGVGAGDA